MSQKKNIKLGLNNIYYLFFLFICPFILFADEIDVEKKFTEIKVLNKVTSKNISLKLINGEKNIFDDLEIKSIKCKNSEFDDDPETVAYIQVIDKNIKNNNEVFVFNGWMFSSSPSINPFDHPVYDIWLISCN